MPESQPPRPATVADAPGPAPQYSTVLDAHSSADIEIYSNLESHTWSCEMCHRWNHSHTRRIAGFSITERNNHRPTNHVKRSRLTPAFSELMLVISGAPSDHLRSICLARPRAGSPACHHHLSRILPVPASPGLGTLAVPIILPLRTAFRSLFRSPLCAFGKKSCSFTCCRRQPCCWHWSAEACHGSLYVKRHSPTSAEARG